MYIKKKEEKTETRPVAKQLMANTLNHQLRFCKRKTNPQANKHANGAEGLLRAGCIGCSGVQIDNAPSVVP